MSTPIPEEKIVELRELILRGRKIEAIKLYRKITRLDLKASKEAVEQLEVSLRKDHPEKFLRQAQGKGCLGGSAALCLCAIAAIFWLFLE